MKKVIYGLLIVSGISSGINFAFGDKISKNIVKPVIAEKQQNYSQKQINKEKEAMSIE